MLIPLKTAVEQALKRINDPTQWESLVINKRKPVTFRAFTMYNDQRICLHRFEACTESEAFIHPHQWPCRVLVLQGNYHMLVGSSKTIDDVHPQFVMDMHLTKGSSYTMERENTWHAVHPKSLCYSLMVNGPRYEDPNAAAPSTSGKGLVAMDSLELTAHLTNFKTLLQKHIKHSS